MARLKDTCVDHMYSSFYNQKANISLKVTVNKLMLVVGSKKNKNMLLETQQRQ